MAKMDLNDDDEKVNTETIFWSAMDMLSDDDKKLPQVVLLCITMMIWLASILLYYFVILYNFVLY